YVWNLVARMPADSVSVLAPNWRGWREHDDAVPFEVQRWPSTLMWPTRELASRVRSMARAHRADVVVFGHGYPLPLLGPRLAVARRGRGASAVRPWRSQGRGVRVSIGSPEGPGRAHSGHGGRSAVGAGHGAPDRGGWAVPAPAGGPCA